MLRVGKDIALLCEICHKPIAVSRIKLRPHVRTCSRQECNSQVDKKKPLRT